MPSLDRNPTARPAAAQRYIVTGDGDSRDIRYVVIDQATDRIVQRFKDQGLALARAYALNRRHNEREGLS